MHELIDKYFEKGLDAKEQLAFDELLTSDAYFREEFEFQQNVKATITQHERDNLKQKMNAWDKEDVGQVETPIKSGRKFTLRNFMATAAMLAILVTASYFMFNGKSSPSELYADNYTTLDNVIYSIDRGDGDSSLIKKAFLAYEANEFESAEKLFNSLRVFGNNPDYQLYQAICQLEMKDYASARYMLRQYVKSPNATFIDRGQWYLALANLKLDNASAAKEVLNELQSTSDYKAYDVKRLLKKLK